MPNQDHLDVQICQAASLSSSQNLSQLSQSEENSELSQLLESIPNKILGDLLHKRCEDSKGEPLPFIKAIFLGSPVETAVDRRIQIIFKVIKLLDIGTLSNKKADEIITYLLTELETLEDALIIDLVNSIFKSIQQNSTGKSSEFLPKCLEIISKLEKITIDGKTYTGANYKDILIEKLCSFEWPITAVTTIVSSFREIDIRQDQFKKFVEKIIHQFDKFEPTDLATLIYHLLLLSTKGLKDRILSAILTHMNHLDQYFLQKSNLSSNQWHQIQGTVIWQIDFAIKQDQSLGKEILKLSKQSNIPLTPFNLGILLAMGRIQRFEEKVFNHLKSLATSNFRIDQGKQPFWLESIELFKTNVSISDVILTTVKYAGKGWDIIVPSLITFGLILMDNNSKNDHSPSNPIQKSINLGHNILLETFKLQKIVRPQVLEQILSRILTKSENATHYIDLLSQITSESPQELLDFSQKIKESFDYISYLNPMIAEGFLRAVKPLIQFNPSFQDHIILVLRKSIFSREQNARLIAVSGFLLLLQTLTETQQSENVSFEILSFLKRCLSQQASIRETLYKGLSDIFITMPFLAEPIFDILLSQIKKYLTSNPPGIVLEACLDKDSQQIVEPLHHLLNCILKCLNHHQATNPPSASFHLLKEIFSTIQKKVREADLEEFDLQECDFSKEYYQQEATLLFGIYEVLIESEIHEKENQNLHLLFDRIFQLEKTMNDNSGLKEAAKGKSKNKIPKRSDRVFLFSPSCCLKLFNYDGKSTNALIYAIQACLQNLKEFLSPSSKKDCFDYVCRLGDLSFSNFIQTYLNQDKMVSDLCLECITHTTNYICHQSVDKIIAFFENILSFEEEKADLSSIIDRLEEMSKAMVSRELFAVAEIILLIIRNTSEHLSDLRSHIQWVTELCETEITNISLAKTVLNLYLNWNERFSNSKARLEVASELYDDQNSILKVINEKTKPALTIVLLSSLDKSLSDIEQAINGLKIASQKKLEDEKSEEHWQAITQARELIYEETDTIVNVLDTILRSTPSNPQVADHLFKVLNRIYKILTLLSKDLIETETKPSPKFEKLIAFSGVDLTPHIHEYLGIVTNDNEKVSKAKIIKESRLIPNLVFSMEKYEVILIKLSNKSKVPLMRNFKRSSMRDFQIKQRLVSSQSVEETSVEPKSKKPKTSKKSTGSKSKSTAKKSKSTSKQGKKKKSEEQVKIKTEEDIMSE